MPSLQRLHPQPQDLIPRLEVASDLWSRMKGLLGRRELQPDQGLWIHHCNSIHTFFMQFPIDCVFVDRDLRVKAVVKDVQPGRVVWPVWGASSVFELRAGVAEHLRIQVGEALNVGA